MMNLLNSIFLITFIHMISFTGGLGQSERVISTLLDSAYQMESTDPINAINTYKEVISIAKAGNDLLNKGRALSYIALVFMSEGSYDSLAHYNAQALNAFKQINYKKGIASIYNNGANAFLYQGFYTQAMKLYQQALPYYEEEGEEYNLTVILNNMASLFQFNENHEKSIIYLRRALEIAKKLKDPHTLGNTYNNLSAGYIATDQLLQAYPRSDSAVYFINQTDDIEMQIKVEGNHSRVAAQLGKSEKALRLLNSIREKNTGLNKLELDIVVDQTSAIYHQSIGEHSKAISFGIKSLEKLQVSKDTNYELDVLQLLRDEFRAIGNFKMALTYAQKLDALKSASFFAQNNRQVLELETLYQSKLKDIQISGQNLELERRKNQTAILFSALLSLGLLSIIGFFFFQERKKRAEQNEVYQKQEIKNLKQQQRLIALDYIVQGQEEERTRIAQDLHDGLGGILSSIRLQIKTIQEEIDALSKVNIAGDVERMISLACNEVRRISHDMMPASLASLGFIDTIEDLVADLKSQSDMDVQFNNEGSTNHLSDKVKVNLYRIIQEASTNVLRHSKATTYKVDLKTSKDQIDILLSDNGIGFKEHRKESSDGIGLRNIKSRIEYLSGRIEVDSSNGTTIKIIVPLVGHENSLSPD